LSRQKRGAKKRQLLPKHDVRFVCILSDQKDSLWSALFNFLKEKQGLVFGLSRQNTKSLTQFWQMLERKTPRRFRFGFGHQRTFLI
jgi:hypothetical protein